MKKSPLNFIFFSFCRFFGPLAAILLLCLTTASLPAQSDPDWLQHDPLDSLNDQHLLKPALTYNSRRFWVASATGATLYGAATYGLWKTWYSNYERGPFQTIDDFPEWLQMDKAGHAFTAYQYARFSRAAANWTGMPPKTAAWTAFGISTLLQGTLELLDAYSVRWGFSWSDMAANTLGAGLHLGQELAWGEQRILLKVGNSLRRPPDVTVIGRDGGSSSLAYISNQRFGSGLVERFLKDYNEQTIWLSVNPKAFLPLKKLPDWLNLAVGYGAQNIYGAYGNSWFQDGENFFYPAPRYRQWYLSPDIYFSRIPTKKRWVRLVLGALDFFKMPAPALEYSQGKLRGRWLMW